MTKYIMSPYLPHATQKKDGSQPSHRAGWAIMWGKQLDAKLIHNNDIPNDCQMLYLEPGMEFNGELKSFNLADRYVHEILRIKNKYRINNVEVVELLPAEHESRRLPKTGFYKKKPFYGTWEQRSELVNIFNHVLQQGTKHYGGYTTIPWPTEYVHHTEVTIDGKEVSGIFKECKNQDLIFKKGMLRFSVMEKPHSVHVAPSYYLWSII
jgi:hypothetical protein